MKTFLRSVKRGSELNKLSLENGKIKYTLRFIGNNVFQSDKILRNL